MDLVRPLSKGLLPSIGPAITPTKGICKLVAFLHSGIKEGAFARLQCAEENVT
jgi:hypothetical protein